MKTIEQLQEENAALAAQVESKEFERVAAVTQATNMFDALRMAIAAFDKYEMDVDVYPSIEHVKMRERLYNSTFKNADWHLRELRAEAGRAGYLACATEYGLENAHASKEGIARNANQYAEQIRWGGAE